MVGVAVKLSRTLVLVAVCCAQCCSSVGQPATPVAAPQAASIQHVVVIVQENRSFVDLFRGFPGTDAPSYGYLGSKKIALKPVPLEDPNNIANNFPDAIAAWNNGKMNGFDQEQMYGTPKTFPYAYVPNTRKEAGPYWFLARKWVLADRMFPMEFGESFTAHLALIAGTSNLNPQLAEVDGPNAWPWTCDAPPGTITYTLTPQRNENANGPFPCFTQMRTMADTLDAANISWRYYVPPVSNLGGKAWTEFGAIKAVRYGPDWKNVVTPETAVLSDIHAGRLPQVAWVIPDIANSDHPGSGSNTGPSWVASVVNAIGESAYWKSTAIVLLWDDWGGWYDDAPPPQLDFRGLAIRVPCLVVSPYARIAAGAKNGYVSHTQYESGSVLKLIEEIFGLPPVGPARLGYTDTRAASLIDTL
ncbi:MAG TPA: alkaline phosphatase family protein, partial [Candidatus Babeliales bacterium]|nr:alkaline phosphatase family protein [Candidatus Babeliales bacterium]